MSTDQFPISTPESHPTKAFLAKVDRASFGEFAAQGRLQRIWSAGGESDHRGNRSAKAEGI